MSRVTDFDRAVAKTLRGLREQAKFTQPHVAGHLGITYQSYQKMESGRHAFRASTLDKLAQLYGIPMQQIAEGSKVDIDPSVAKITLMAHALSPEDRDIVLELLCRIKNGVKS